MRKVLLFGGVLLSAVLIWFTASNYQSARPIAEENLRGLALSLTSAIENIAIHDPTLQNLGTFKSQDIAFFALIDRKGLYRFHTNSDLIGTPIQGVLPLPTLQDGTTSYERINLRTGEIAFEFNAPIYLSGETLVLRLTLHTYRADTVIRRAELNMIVLLCLLAAGWVLALALYRFTWREEQRKLEMAHRESLAQLGEVGAMLAHEIRNPLSGIKGYAQVIEKKPQDERNSGFAHRIVSETLRLETLVSDLLSYAKSDRESMLTLNLSAVVSHVVALLQPEAEQLNIKFICEFTENILIYSNQDRLSQVLLNVVKNAIQSISESGSIKITSSVDGKYALVKVSDTGQGISMEDLPRIFEPFYTTKARGTGLGLALCKKIVEEHGGKITVQSSVGEGTTVSISIPIRQSRSKK
ncbi:histidine kinase [Geobacter pelophilus]|uniref:histidine kinase n=1 Tax=Geoanaerobacter pelophilus TaxID=60036 RepID=A0AAW4L231_9BACT|nr:ATP-binding protein [Geoanaerobacter pelophilus]MBT0663038.1 histidine kinase [Geoanaerobacter pelophilus]